MSEIIEVIVGPDGSTKITAEGYTGSSCQEATRALEESLGVVIDDALTADYYVEERAKAGR